MSATVKDAVNSAVVGAVGIDLFGTVSDAIDVTEGLAVGETIGIDVRNAVADVLYDMMANAADDGVKP